MSADYGFWGEAHYDNEAQDISDRGAYDRILNSIYKKGKEAGRKHHGKWIIPSPYRRSDYAAIFELGFFNGWENAPLGSELDIPS